MSPPRITEAAGFEVTSHDPLFARGSCHHHTCEDFRRLFLIGQLMNVAAEVFRKKMVYPRVRKEAERLLADGYPAMRPSRRNDDLGKSTAQSYPLPDATSGRSTENLQFTVDYPVDLKLGEVTGRCAPMKVGWDITPGFHTHLRGVYLLPRPTWIGFRVDFET